MRRAFDRIEEDFDTRELVLSMRAKMVLGGLCFFLLLVALAYPGVPHVAEAIRDLAQGELLVENQSQNKKELLQEQVDEELLLRDDFDDPEIYNLWDKIEAGTGTITFRDGFAFLNTTNQTRADEGTAVGLWHQNRNFYRYAGVEIRLRCSDDNRMGSDIGGGWRLWGFWDFHAPHKLFFSCASPESPPEKTGLQAHSTVY